jgi:aspartyl protease family protein
VSIGDPYGGSGGGNVLGWAVRALGIWAAIGLVVYVAVDERGMLFDGNTAMAKLVTPGEAPPTGTLSYRADQRGHFWVDAAVNGAPVRFMIDTGASAVVLTMSDAAAAGYGRGNLSFNIAMSTANGRARAAQIKLREVRIGQLAISDVQAMVAENLNTSLLGMTFLKRLDAFEIRDGVLTINWN